MTERKSLIEWIKEHKKELIIAGVSIGTLILLIFGIRNGETVKTVWDSLKKGIKNPAAKVPEEIVKVVVDVPPAPIQEIVTVVPSNSSSLPFEVRRHIRNLPEGWHASPEKVAEALKYNIVLMDGQTWVDSYRKGGAAA